MLKDALQKNETVLDNSKISQFLAIPIDILENVPTLEQKELWSNDFDLNCFQLAKCT